jgi:hypothetical protein
VLRAGAAAPPLARRAGAVRRAQRGRRRCAPATRAAAAAPQTPAPARPCGPAPQEWCEAADEGQEALEAIQRGLEDLEGGGGGGGGAAGAAAAPPPPALAALLQLVGWCRAPPPPRARRCPCAVSLALALRRCVEAAALRSPTLPHPTPSPLPQAPSFALQRHVAAADGSRGGGGAAGGTPPADTLEWAHARLRASVGALEAACGAARGARDALVGEALAAAASPAEAGAGGAAGAAAGDAAAGGGGGDTSSWGAAEWALPVASVAGAVAKSTEWMVGAGPAWVGPAVAGLRAPL